MITIASHNDSNALEIMLLRLSEITTNEHQICVVDTNSRSNDYRKRTDYLKRQFPKVIFNRVDYDCWDSGAYIHSFEMYSARKHIFLQDSVYIANKNFIVEIDQLLDTNDVVPIFNFRYHYDSIEQQYWVESNLPVQSWPKDGIFGPIFAINTKALEKIPRNWLKKPTSKVEACGMERKWALIFHILKMKKQYYEFIPRYRTREFFDYHPDFRMNLAKQWRSRI